MNKKEYLSPSFVFIRVEMTDDALKGSVEYYSSYVDDDTDWGDDVIYDDEFNNW